MKTTRFLAALLALASSLMLSGSPPLRAQEPEVRASGGVHYAGATDRIELTFSPSGGEVHGRLWGSGKLMGESEITGTLQGTHLTGTVHPGFLYLYGKPARIEGEMDLRAGEGSGKIVGIVEGSWQVEWTPGAPTTPTPVPEGGVLCPEALARWPGLPPDSKAIVADYEDLLAQFERAIQQFDAEGGQARVRYKPTGSLPAALWLSCGGGLGFKAFLQSKERGHEFTFLSKGDVETISNYKPLRPIGRGEMDTVEARKIVKRGTEPSLKVAVIEYDQAQGRPLSPGDLFYLALRERDGDATEALLLAHNMLRSVMRGTDEEFSGLCPDPDFAGRYLQVIRRGDNGGPWYHLFGTAYFEMIDRNGTLGNATGLGPEAAERLAQLPGPPVLSEFKGEADFTRPEARTWLSRLANWYEQIQRQVLEGQAPDAEKYCFNVWGARLGSWLYRERLPRYGMPEPGPAPKGTFHRETFQPRTVYAVLSPVDVTWEDGGGRTVFDQEAESLDGDMPIHLLPLYEQGSHTWGLVWDTAPDAVYTVTLRAVGAGTVHLVRMAPAQGTAAVYAAPVVKGEELAIAIRPGQDLPELQRVGGPGLEPVLTTLGPVSAPGAGEAATPAAPSGGETPLPTPAPESSSGGLLCGAGLVALLCLGGLGGVGVALVARRAVRRRGKGGGTTGR